MHILTAEARTHYLEKYPIDDFSHLISIPI